MDSSANYEIKNLLVMNQVTQDNNYNKNHKALLQNGAESVLMLIVPVSICLLVVVTTITSVKNFTQTDGVYWIYTPFHEEVNISHAEKFGQGVKISVIVVGGGLIKIILSVVLYKYRCYKLIKGLFGLSSLALLFFFSYTYFKELLRVSNIAMDYISGALIIWNFGVVGMICIHWKGPLLLQQGYLILSSALFALVLIKYLPEWTLWCTLAAISLYDIFAVFCPYGPLRILVNLAHERNEQLFPALVYSATAMYSMTMDDTEQSEGAYSRFVSQQQEQNKVKEPERTDDDGCDARQTDGNNDNIHASAARTLNEHNAEQPSGDVTDEEAEECGLELGLGDFIFYSVFLGKVASYKNWNTTIACFLAILIGLCLILIPLAIYRKALPALPISIAFGLAFNFATRYLVQPFTDALSSEQAFI